MKKTQAMPSTHSAHFDDALGVVLDAFTQPLIVKDAHSRFRFLNEAACGLFGSSLGELAGRTDHAILPRAEADRIRELDKLVLASGAEISTEGKITAADGKRKASSDAEALCRIGQRRRERKDHRGNDAGYRCASHRRRHQQRVRHSPRRWPKGAASHSGERGAFPCNCRRRTGDDLGHR